MKRAFATLIVIVVLLAMLVGFLLAGELRDLTSGRDHSQPIQVEKPPSFWDQALDFVRFLFEAGWRLLLLAVPACLLVVAYRWLDRRSSEIKPGPDGQFPLVRVAVIPVVSEGFEMAQIATTARSQAVQLASAVHKHPPVLAGVKGKHPPAAAGAGAAPEGGPVGDPGPDGDGHPGQRQPGGGPAPATPWSAG